MDLLERSYVPTDVAEEVRSRANVARAIAVARAERGWTQADLGAEAGTKQSRVSEIESFKGNPRFDTLDRIALALGLMITLVPRYQIVYTGTETVTAEATTVSGVRFEGMNSVSASPTSYSRRVPVGV